MNSEMLIKQMETYSNAIIAFVVLQGIGYAFAFGTNAHFNCVVKTAPLLAEGLSLLFLLVAALAISALVMIRRTLRGHCGEFANTMEKIYLGKTVVVIVFSLLPLALTVGYGITGDPGKADCRAAAK